MGSGASQLKDASEKDVSEAYAALSGEEKRLDPPQTPLKTPKNPTFGAVLRLKSLGRSWRRR